MRIEDRGMAGPIARLRGLVAAAALAACGGSGGEDGGGVSGADAQEETGGADAALDGTVDAGADTMPSGPCAPEPGRCDALGDDRPGRRSEHGAAWVDDRLEMVVVGGTTAVPVECGFPEPAYVAETWIWDDPCARWTRVDGAGPSPRGRHAMAAGGGHVWLFGGRWRADGSTSGPYTLHDDLWRFDPASRVWEEVASTGAAPSARANAAVAWDDQRDLLWLFGGNTSTSGAAYAPEDDLWSFDPTTSEWTLHDTEPSADAPSPRLLHSMVWDASEDVIAVFGGADETAFLDSAQYFNDLWTWDIAAAVWTRRGRGPAPAGRFWAGLVVDPSEPAWLLFGGHDAGSLGNRNDTWIFYPEDDDWTADTLGDDFLNPANGFCDFPPDFATTDTALPERRNAHTLVWATTCGHAILFGGKTDCGATDDVWTWDTGGWENQVGATEGESCTRWRSNPDNCVNLCL